MKVLSAQQVREADAHTIEHEPISSVDLMERAATACFSWLLAHEELWKQRTIKVVSGIGNNGGDGLVLARVLSMHGCSVEVFVVRFSENPTPDFLTNEQRLEGLPVTVRDLTEMDSKAIFNQNDLIIDAVFGTGLARPVAGWIANVIEAINKSGAFILAIDAPSGLFAEDNSENNGAIIQADCTLTFEVPKLALFFPENGKYVGDWVIIPIGLDQDYIKSVATPFHYLTTTMLTDLIKTRDKFGHKGNYGHSLLVTGSYGKMGAAIMAARACLRSGSGLVSIHCPSHGLSILQEAVPEAMCEPDEDERIISHVKQLEGYNAIGVGPGIGIDQQTENSLKLLIQQATCPMVIDADAINIIAQNKTWIAFVPSASIYTPHPKEFERLVGVSNNSYERLCMQMEFSQKNGCYVVLKGAHTAISCPDGEVYFNSTGNPGMAKGGSGDVLTGIITGLLAQGYSSKEAALLGVFLHGMAGDIGAERVGGEALLASDVIDSIGLAINRLRG